MDLLYKIANLNTINKLICEPSSYNMFKRSLKIAPNSSLIPRKLQEHKCVQNNPTNPYKKFNLESPNLNRRTIIAQSLIRSFMQPCQRLRCNHYNFGCKLIEKVSIICNHCNA
ncbi:unnamed protein product [Owenia fusiformis]|uniref:Uncharacterized protein n=1 Tax=Owenia fusiformis TaxID=6347 RepID=A0A8S4N9K7_OWEFU|nr:unnamed protein product [Owenia fusiformis]